MDFHYNALDTTLAEDEPLTEERILIIGFGIAGIVATHQFVTAGYSPVVVTDAPDVGGVWSMLKQYPSLQTNNTKNTWEFPEMPATEQTYDDFPRQEQVAAYLQSYVDKFGLVQYVRFNTKVTKLGRSKQGEQWVYHAELASTSSRATHDDTVTFDRVIVATGSQSIPLIPEGFQAAYEQSLKEAGQKKSGPKVLHASELRKHLSDNPSLLKGNKVVVVGMGSKSGDDVASFATREASQVVLVGTARHWNVPRYIGDNDPTKGTFNEDILYSRCPSAWMLPGSPEAVESKGSYPYMYKFFQTTRVGKALRDAFWSKISADIVQQFDIPEDLIPKKRMVEDIKYIAIQNPDFFPLVKKGVIKVEFGRALGFENKHERNLVYIPHSAQHAETMKDVDVVILATGFRTSLGFLSREMKDKLINKEGQYELYRGVYNPYLGSSIAFLGFQHNLCAPLCAALASRWILELFKGERGALQKNGILDDQAMISRSIEAGIIFDRRHNKEGQAKGYGAGQISTIMYCDGVLGDLGIPNFSSNQSGVVSRYTGKVLPRHYAGVMTAQLC